MGKKDMSQFDPDNAVFGSRAGGASGSGTGFEEIHQGGNVSSRLPGRRTASGPAIGGTGSGSQTAGVASVVATAALQGAQQAEKTAPKRYHTVHEQRAFEEEFARGRGHLFIGSGEGGDS